MKDIRRVLYGLHSEIRNLKSEIGREVSMSVAEMDQMTQYLTFKLQDEIFALDISTVREVLDYTVVTRVPRTPDFMRGVINLRGSVVPVIDLRLKFGMTVTEKTVNTCVIIVEVKVGNETVILGVLADSVQEVMDLDADNIEPAPKIGTHLKTGFIKGMGKRNNGFLMLLDIDKVFSYTELDSVRTGASADEPAPAGESYGRA